jgi:hypothetical protein
MLYWLGLSNIRPYIEAASPPIRYRTPTEAKLEDQLKLWHSVDGGLIA